MPIKPIILSLLFLIPPLYGNVIAAQEVEAWDWTVPNTEDHTILLLTGDTNIQDRDDPVEGFRYLLPTLHEADLRFTNLEGPFADNSSDPRISTIPHKHRWRHSDPEMIKGLLEARIEAVGVANNVTYPWQALMQSIEVLDAHGIQHTGGGADYDEARRPVVIEREGTKFGFIQYTSNFWPYQHAATADVPGAATVKVDTWYGPPRQVLDKPGQPPIIKTEPDPAELQRMIDDITALSADADVVVASYHWGVSGQKEVVDYQRTVAHAAIDAGADIVMGHGPHVLQEVEVYQGRPIFYSLGNFVFDYVTDVFAPYGLLARAVVEDGRLVQISMVPLHRDGPFVYMLDPNEGIGRELFLELAHVCDNIGTELDVEGMEIVVRGVSNEILTGER